VNGLEATRQITNALPATRVVMLTISEEDKDLFEAIKCGAHGYLSKKVEPEKLCELLEGVFLGEAPLSGVTAARILKEFATQASKGFETSPVNDLTPREKEVLQLLAAGLTNKDIGSRLDIAENTVKKPSQKYSRETSSPKPRAGRHFGDPARHGYREKT